MEQLDKQFDVIDKVEVPPILNNPIGKIIPTYKLGESQDKAFNRHLDNIEQALRLIRHSKQRIHRN